MIFIIDDDFSICAIFDVSTVIKELRKILHTSKGQRISLYCGLPIRHATYDNCYYVVGRPILSKIKDFIKRLW